LWARPAYTSGSCTYNLRLVSLNTTQVELHEEVTAGACEPDYAIVAVKDGKLTEKRLRALRPTTRRTSPGRWRKSDPVRGCLMLRPPAGQRGNRAY